MRYLDELLSWEFDQRREWLLFNQPEAEVDRTNWWLRIIEPVSSMVTDIGERSFAERVQWAELAVAVLDLALEVDAIEDREVLIRSAYLSAALVKRAESEVPARLLPDVVALRCLEYIDMPFDEVVELSKDWRSLPIEGIRRPRRFKSVLAPLEMVVLYVKDGKLRDRVDTWLAVRVNLP